MRVVTRSLGLAAGVVVVAVVGLGAGPASGQATVIKCSDIPFEDNNLGGVVVFTASGRLNGNCYEHVTDGSGGSTGGSATTVDCAEDFGEGSNGVSVTTPSGNTLTNCKIRAG